MLILKPTTDSQTASIYPRFSDDTGKYLFIRKDGEGVSEVVDFVQVTEMSYYTDISFASTILKEGETYTVEVYSVDLSKTLKDRVDLESGVFEDSSCAYDYFNSLGNTIWYKDKIFVTSQGDYTVKHELAQPSYTEYEDTDDNTFIIR